MSVKSMFSCATDTSLVKSSRISVGQIILKSNA